MRRVLSDSGHLHGGVLDADTLASTPRSYPTARGLRPRQSSGSRSLLPWSIRNCAARFRPHDLALVIWCPDSRGRSSTYVAQKNVSTCLFLYQQSDGAVSGVRLCAPLLRCPLPACL